MTTQINPLRSLSFGAGVQSTALLMLILNRDPRLIEAVGGVGQFPTTAIFADPQSESRATYEHVEAMKSLCADRGFPLHIATAGDLLDDLLHAKRFASIPAFTKAPNGDVSLLRRQCTREYKIEPIKQKLRSLMGLKYRQRVKRQCVVWIGISIDEINRVKPSRIKWQTSYWPLIEMRWRRGDCLNYLREIGLERVGKSACVFCPFHSDRGWLEIKREDPEAWQKSVNLDRLLRDFDKRRRGGVINELYLHRSGVPLEEVDLNENQGDLFNQWDNECEGMCGV